MKACASVLIKTTTTTHATTTCGKRIETDFVGSTSPKNLALTRNALFAIIPFDENKKLPSLIGD